MYCQEKKTVTTKNFFFCNDFVSFFPLSSPHAENSSHMYLFSDTCFKLLKPKKRITVPSFSWSLSISVASAQCKHCRNVCAGCHGSGCFVCQELTLCFYRVPHCADLKMWSGLESLASQNTILQIN